MKVSELILETLPVGDLQCNFTILGDPVSRKAIVWDPGGDAEMLIEPLVKLDLQVKLFTHTHAHLDHFLASTKLKEATGQNWHCTVTICFFGTCWMIIAGCSEFLLKKLLHWINGWKMKSKLRWNVLRSRLFIRQGTRPVPCFFVWKAKAVDCRWDSFPGLNCPYRFIGRWLSVDWEIHSGKLYRLDEDISVINGFG